jgi:hypothetical protein
MDTSKYSLEDLLILFDKENKKVVDLARRLSGIKAEIADIKGQLGYAEDEVSRS